MLNNLIIDIKIPKINLLTFIFELTNKIKNDFLQKN